MSESAPAAGTPRWRAADFGVAQAQVRGEDAFNQKRASVKGEQLFMTVVADGAKTKTVARHCCQNVLRLIESKIEGKPSLQALELACRKAFDAIHTQVVAEMGYRAGATSTLSVFVLNETRKEYVVANVGNSHMVSVRNDNLDLLTGEQLFPGGPGTEELEKPKVKPRLKPSKSRRAHMIGEALVGSTAAPEPSVHSGSVPADGLYVLIATDGFWDVMGRESTLNVLTSASRKLPASDIARKAVNVCKTHQSSDHEADDVLVIVVRFMPGEAGAPEPADGPKDKKGGCVVS